MVNLSRRQTMQTCCWVSGIQFLRAGGWSGGLNFDTEARFRFSVEFRSVLFEDGVCVGVLPTIHMHHGDNIENMQLFIPAAAASERVFFERRDVLTCRRHWRFVSR